MLTAPCLPDFPAARIDDPRLREVIVSGLKEPQTLQPGQAVLLGFPIDEGVRRNGGRIGAAGGPDAIRGWLYRLTPMDAPSGLNIRTVHLLDWGNLRPLQTLEESQRALGLAVGHILGKGAVPIVLGGGHETAFGHFLGYVNAGIRPAIVNLDAHLDVRPAIGGLSTSGTSFRQAMQHERAPLEPGRYACLGLQAPSVSREHWEFCRLRGDILVTAEEMRGRSSEMLARTCTAFEQLEKPIYLSVDADVAAAADVPGVSTPILPALRGMNY